MLYCIILNNDKDHVTKLQRNVCGKIGKYLYCNKNTLSEVVKFWSLSSLDHELIDLRVGTRCRAKETCRDTYWCGHAISSQEHHCWLCDDERRH